MLVLSYADLILARQLLPADAAGAYAVGAVLTKGALWAPQVVTVLAVPRLAAGTGAAAGRGPRGGRLRRRPRRRDRVAGELAVRLAGGERYAGLAAIAPYFALTGALYA